MKDDSFRDFVLDQLAGLEARSRAMFGGHGFYCGEVFFGIVYGGTLLFKTDADTARAYQERGMKPFQPGPPGSDTTMSRYYEVPLDVLEDRTALLRWARASVAAAGPPRSARRRGSASTARRARL